MRRFFARARHVLLLAVALAVAAALSGGTAAHAATAEGSGTPCSLNPATSCQSTDGTVALNIDYSDASACTFTWHVDWGDGKVSDVTVTDPADGYVLLAQHTYANANTYTISATGQATTENCETTPFTGHFTLLSPDPGCPTAQIIGVRGSKGIDDHYGTSDSLLNALEPQLKRLIPGAVFENTPYPAVPVGDWLIFYGLEYDTSINAGKYALHAEIADSFDLCPHTPIILLGWSQGAQIDEQVFLTLPGSWQKKIILDMFGNPVFDGADSAVNRGSYNPHENGVATVTNKANLVKFQPQQDANVHSYCIHGDPVCNTSVRNLVCNLITGSCAHLQYVTSGYTTESAGWVLNRWLAIRNQI